MFVDTPGLCDLLQLLDYSVGSAGLIRQYNRLACKLAQVKLHPQDSEHFVKGEALGATGSMVPTQQSQKIAHHSVNFFAFTFQTKHRIIIKEETARNLHQLRN